MPIFLSRRSKLKFFVLLIHWFCNIQMLRSHHFQFAHLNEYYITLLLLFWWRVDMFSDSNWLTDVKYVIVQIYLARHTKGYPPVSVSNSKSANLMAENFCIGLWQFDGFVDSESATCRAYRISVWPRIHLLCNWLINVLWTVVQNSCIHQP